MASRQRERRRCLEILGVQEDATDDDIRKAYRRMALIYHPDKNESDDAKEKFQEIGYAYKYLTEGPSAVGFEEDGHFSGHAGGHDIPIEILIRLFPWMTRDFGLSRPSPFGGLFGHHFSSPFHQSPFESFFMDPFSSMHGYDDDDDDDGEEIVFIQNGRITVMKTGNGRGNYGRRRYRHTQRRRNNDSQQFRSSPLHSRPNQYSSHNHHSSNSYRPTNENVGNSQNRHSSGTFHSSSSTTKESYPKRSTENKTSHTNSKQSNKPSTAYYENDIAEDSSTPVSHNSTGYNKTDYKSKTDTANSTDKTKSTNKNKPQTVITSRKERKKMKKANKTANQPKTSTTEEKTTPCSQEETTEPVDTISDDEISIDDQDDFGSTQVPLKLNKKQRRKLKRERERLEKEMAQNSSRSSPISPDFLSSAREGAQEVEDDGESTTSSAAYDTDFSTTDAKSRRAKKNQKRKQRPETTATIHTPDYDDLQPKSKYDEEEMLRIALEMSKMDVQPNTKDQYSDSQSNDNRKSKSKHEKLVNGQGHSSSSQGQGKGSKSWYDDIGTSPFQNPMEDMKKTYYKDMSSSHFDPGSYYRSGQRSTGSHSQANKENYANQTYKQRQGADSKQKSQGSRYFYSKNYKPHDEVDGKSDFSHIDRHHQKYFKSTSHKHSFDLDEPDDVPLNVSDSKSREAQNGSFRVGEVLNSSLNVPKGIHVNHANHFYVKK